MSDGQSRCEYDEPEKAAPQERLKGGVRSARVRPHHARLCCFFRNVFVCPGADIMSSNFTSFISCESADQMSASHCFEGVFKNIFFE